MLYEVITGQYGKIEIWSKTLYEQIEVDDDDFAGMAENIMEGLVDETDEWWNTTCQYYWKKALTGSRNNFV